MYSVSQGTSQKSYTGAFAPGLHVPGLPGSGVLKEAVLGAGDVGFELVVEHLLLVGVQLLQEAVRLYRRAERAGPG